MNFPLYQRQALTIIQPRAICLLLSYLPRKFHEIIQSIVAGINTADSGNRDGALTQLSTEGNHMLQQLRNQIMRAQEQVQPRLRQVCLYITTDGKNTTLCVID